MPGEDPVEPPSWFEASERTLDPLLNAASLPALVEGAEASGLLRALRVTATASEVARETDDVMTRTLRDLPGQGGFADLSTADRLTYAGAV